MLNLARDELNHELPAVVGSDQKMCKISFPKYWKWMNVVTTNMGRSHYILYTCKKNNFSVNQLDFFPNKRIYSH
jgi:hypothetical protein